MMLLQILNLDLNFMSFWFSYKETACCNRPTYFFLGSGTLVVKGLGYWAFNGKVLS